MSPELPKRKTGAHCVCSLSSSAFIYLHTNRNDIYDAQRRDLRIVEGCLAGSGAGDQQIQHLKSNGVHHSREPQKQECCTVSHMTRSGRKYKC